MSVVDVTSTNAFVLDNKTCNVRIT